MKTDDQSAKAYAEKQCSAINGAETYLRSEVYNKIKIAYMDGCQKVRTETENAKNTPNSWTEKIRCPECKSIQSATVTETPLWNIYVHECECGYIIGESEWCVSEE